MKWRKKNRKTSRRKGREHTDTHTDGITRFSHSRAFAFLSFHASEILQGGGGRERRRRRGRSGGSGGRFPFASLLFVFAFRKSSVKFLRLTHNSYRPTHQSPPFPTLATLTGTVRLMGQIWLPQVPDNCPAAIPVFVPAAAAHPPTRPR